MTHKILITIAILFSLNFSNISAQFQLEVAFPNLTFSNPVDLQHPGDGTNRLFVVEQSGRIRVFENNSNVSSTEIFLNIQSRVSSGGEKGLLGLAFHPDYEDSGYFYVYYSTTGSHRSRVSRFSVNPNDPNDADENSEFTLLEVTQPFSNHNGGQIAFGPEGYLYIGLGDGGSGGDPQNHGQNLTTLLGTISRIDVNTPSGALNYSIPMSNPFFENTQGYREEIYAYGLRNPWRFSFDPITSWLWCGDVGQNAWEEVDIIQSGKNYGWRVMEATHCFNPPSGCDTTGLTMPVWEYGHNSSGGFSITGGYVYRADPSSDLYGKYIYGDYVTGNIWALEYDGVNPPANTLLQNSSLSISSFGVDKFNNIYICSFDGKIYRFEEPVVPVEFVSFTANVAGKQVTLNWETATETNNMGFEIERTTPFPPPFEGGGVGDGGGWMVIGFVEGNGSTTQTINYSFTDIVDQRGAYFYRLKQIDFDGSFEYSSIVEVVASGIPSGYILEQNYPNPFNPGTIIKFTFSENTKASLKIFDALGNEVAVLFDSTADAGKTYDLFFNAEGMASGVYFYKLSSDKINETKKMLFLK